MKRAALLAVVLATGCATAPVVDFSTPESISVRYDPVLVSPQEAGATAQSHCQGHGKNAAIVSRQQMGGWQVMNFDCR